METQKEKFRIKIIELNGGTYMYHPQIYVGVGTKTYMFFIKRKYYEWRGFEQTDYGIDVIWGSKTWFDKECNGNGSSDINDAYKLIEEFKTQSQKRYELMEKKEKQEFNEATKSVTFINIK